MYLIRSFLASKSVKRSASFCLALALVCSLTADAGPASSRGRFKKVVVVVLENTDYAEGLKQPFLASLAAKGALLTKFQAEAHPSQPNYIAMISGSTQGVS